jgi:hypothetical protein
MLAVGAVIRPCSFILYPTPHDDPSAVGALVKAGPQARMRASQNTVVDIDVCMLPAAIGS